MATPTIPNITKPTLDNDILDFTAQLASFASGKLYVTNGGFTQESAATTFATKTSTTAALASHFLEIADLAEKPGKIESNVDKLKTSNYTIEGRRTNTIELSLVGLNSKRKQWLESELNNISRTFVLLSQTKDSILVFNARRWTCNWVYEIEELAIATISTEYSGLSSEGFLIYLNLK
jgi:hypothetical protein